MVGFAVQVAGRVTRASRICSAGAAVVRAVRRPMANAVACVKCMAKVECVSVEVGGVM